MYEKEPKAYSDSAHTLEHKDEILCDELIQFPEDTDASFLVNSATCFRRNGADHTAIKIQKMEDRYLADVHVAILLSPLKFFFLMPSWQVGGICFL